MVAHTFSAEVSAFVPRTTLPPSPALTEASDEATPRMPWGSFALSAAPADPSGVIPASYGTKSYREFDGFDDLYDCGADEEDEDALCMDREYPELTKVSL